MTNKLGRTGDFPDGKMSDDDNGGLRLQVAKMSNSLVRIDFGTPVTWLAMEKSSAIQLAAMLLDAAGSELVMKIPVPKGSA